MSKVSKALDRMSELSILAQDVTKGTADLALYQKEFSKLGAYIDDLGTKDFNGVSLFSGSDLAVTIDSELRGHLANAFLCVTPLVVLGAVIVLRGRSSVESDIEAARTAAGSLATDPE